MNNGRMISLMRWPRAQRGFATLLITLVILTTITFVIIYSARSVLLERNITANDLRGRQAFEAAEAAQEAAVAYLTTKGGRDKNDDGVVDLLFDTDGDALGVGDSDTITLPGGSRVKATMTDADVTLGDLSYTATRIVSTGWSADGSASRTITHVYSYVTPLPNVPENPVLSRGTVVVSGSATIINPEGHSTIWSGGPVDLGGNNTTSTMIADPTVTTDGTNTSRYPSCIGSTSMRPETCDPTTTTCPCAVIRSSDRYTSGLDVIERDGSLANLTSDDFFLNFFGVSKTEFQNNRVTLTTTGANSPQDAPTGINLAVGEVAWVEGNASWSAGTTIGCSVQATTNNSGMFCDGDLEPSLVIVNGDLNLSGGIAVWGLLYVTGAVTGNGSVDVRGAMLMEDPNAGLSGSVRIFYNSAVLRALAESGQLGGGGGSWRDF